MTFAFRKKQCRYQDCKAPSHSGQSTKRPQHGQILLKHGHLHHRYLSVGSAPEGMHYQGDWNQEEHDEPGTPLWLNPSAELVKVKKS